MWEDTILTYNINTYPCRGGYQPPVSICETRLTKGLTNAVLCDMIITDNIKEYIMEEPRSPIFSKKEKIIIISIFAVLFLASIIVTAYLVSEGYPEDFGIPNLLPIFFIIGTIITAILSYIFRHRGFPVYFSCIRTLDYFILIGDKKFTYDAKYLRKHYIDIFIFLAQIPFQIPLIAYINAEDQAYLTLILFFIPAIIFTIRFLIKYNLPSVRKERKKQSEIKEQEERENLQNRFRDRY